MAGEDPILVTGATGEVGGIGRLVLDTLRRRRLPVRALVHREDERAEALRGTGAEVVVGDLTRGADVLRALDGCRRMYFGMGVSSHYLEATVTTAAAARAYGRLEVLVNMSQLTVSQMDLTSTAESTQQRQHWLAEQALDWSGLPVTHVRPTVFMENPLFRVFAYASIAKDGTIRLPFGTGRTSPIAARDVAAVVAEILADPAPHLGRTYELTGPLSRDLTAMAAEFSAALGRPVSYVSPPYEQWVDRELRALSLPDHVFDHLATMARLHAQNRYDRVTRDVEAVTGHPASSVRQFVADNPGLFPPPP
ncbi:NmrA family NAD(P)-binding protein [Peterkaempfera bronchialis]|uniref:Hydroxylase n=1 Tax=Peterkaempfera bronchialis TaxID=2126346 RepID=A0A345SU53_9ACTN|nr:NAD(P)H-binding protein [Peterkaempfera bronchialis]AXI77258.1 hydroxylase [Peterkaempfera bronchialis]